MSTQAPTLVIYMTGGAIQSLASTGAVNIIVMDSDDYENATENEYDPEIAVRQPEYVGNDILGYWGKAIDDADEAMHHDLASALKEAKALRYQLESIKN